MNDKERLEEIKKKYFMYENYTGKVIMYHHVLEWLIEQAERVQELEEEVERYQSGRNVAVITKMKMDELEKQNKRYREALEEIYELAEYDEYDNTLEQIVSEIEKALEGEE